MEIGGYFELELDRGTANFHDTPYRFKSGRAALGFILKVMAPTNVYVPFYTCNALLEPFVKQGIRYTFYHLNEQLEITELPALQPTELLLYVNYFDVKRGYTEKLSAIYGDRFIADCTQSYFLKGNSKSWFFNSCRKFFGVPDGSFLYVPAHYVMLSAYQNLNINTSYLTAHLLARFNGETQKGYPFFQNNDVLNGERIERMSKLTTFLLSNVNEEKAMASRKANFEFLHEQLTDNLLQLSPEEHPLSSFYPYLPKRLIAKEIFWKQHIFIPHLWNDCIERSKDGFDFEKQLSQYLIPIPIDHRYQPGDLVRTVDLLKNID